jgi:cytochrome P450
MASTEALFNSYLPEFHENPYPFYHRLRAEEPVHRSPLGFWVLTRYDDVVMVLRDQRFGREGFEPLLAAVYGSDTEPGKLPRSMLFRDPPDHTRLRGLVSRALRPGSPAGLGGRADRPGHVAPPNARPCAGGGQTRVA